MFIYHLLSILYPDTHTYSYQPNLSSHSQTFCILLVILCYETVQSPSKPMLHTSSTYYLNQPCLKNNSLLSYTILINFFSTLFMIFTFTFKYHASFLRASFRHYHCLINLLFAKLHLSHYHVTVTRHLLTLRIFACLVIAIIHTLITHKPCRLTCMK